MTAFTIVRRSLRFYWRTHLGVVLGAALGALVLTGALLVGDSVKATLRRQAELRVGRADVAMTSGDRFFRAALADAAGPEAAPVLMLRATVARADGAARVNVAQLLGVDHRFWKLAPSSQSGASSGGANEPADVSSDAGVPAATPGGAGVPPAVPGVSPETSGSAGGTPAGPATGTVAPRNGPAAGTAAPLPPDSVALNTRLAHQLGVVAGDTVVVRLEKPGMFSKDAPLSGEENDAVALRVKVARIVDDEHYGRFSLAASQVPPFTVFAPLAMVQEKVEMRGKANLLLATTPENGGTIFGGSLIRVGRVEFPIPDALGERMMSSHLQKQRAEAERERLVQDVRGAIDLADAQLSLLDLSNNAGLELRTPRVFLDPPVIAAAPFGIDHRRVDALTYFVNAIEAGPIGNLKSEIRNQKSTPYSMVTAVETPSSGFLPAELADDEIVISQWEADDLGIGTGAKATLKYFVMGERRELVEKAREFTVLAVLPMNEPQLNSSWMPDFPGLADKKNCRDWKPGFEFDATRMRDKDQEYWEQYRGTPKAFVNLKVGQEMWGNRWGNATVLRWPAGTDRAEIEKELREKLTPEQLGFQFIPLREQALAATKAPVDFGELFVSFSFFLIAAAAALTGLLFVFSLQQRNAEAGLLLALGLRPRLVRRIFLLEGLALALVGSVLGAAGAVLYTKLVLRALATVWRGAVGAVDFTFAPQPMTLAIGVIAGVFIALLAMWLASRKQMRHSARELLSGTECDPSRKRPRLWTAVIPAQLWGNRVSSKSGEGITAVQGLRLNLPVAAGIACIALSLATPFLFSDASAFFGAGALLLIAGLFFALAALRKVDGATVLESLAQLGVRNAARRRGRSLATIGVLASGVFIVVAVDSFRHGPNAETMRRDSGTGGFALVGESALPIYDDLNTAKGREQFALDGTLLKDVSIVPMRVRDGDDASCLNLNRAMEPRLLGVNAKELFERGAFRLNGGNWISIMTWCDMSGAIPGIVDAATLQWALQMKLGDVLTYRDDRGEPLRVKLVATVANSILQGSVLIAERSFVEKFPSRSGYRAFLIDAPAEKRDAVRAELSRGLQDRGLELVPAAQRLAEFQAVENTYLSIFQVLGGLGLLLGSAGLAIVVARNVLERRREFGLLEAVGFRPKQLRQLVFAEHRWLILCGLAIGTASALVAVWPNLRERASGFPYLEMTLLLASLLAGCIFWAWLATRLALRGSGVAALRSE